MSSPSTSNRFAVWSRWAALAAVVLVPLAFAGLATGAVSDWETAGERIPAALVNEDQLIYQTEPDGEQTPVFAGRQLVTDLVDAGDIDWRITNAADAARALEAGEVYGILTIPDDFSESILSVSDADPRQAMLDIRTDDAHAFLAGELSESVGERLAHTFGSGVTTRVITGLYSGIDQLSGSLAEAADGAGTLAGGAADLSSALSTLSSGADSAHAAAGSLASGIDSYTSGVDSLSTGLAALDQGARGLSSISAGVAGFTDGVSGLAARLSAELAQDPVDVTAVTALSRQLSGLASTGGAQLNSVVPDAIAETRGGIASISSGAAALSASSAPLRSGAASMTDGLGDLASGTAALTSGANGLTTGAEELASGLQAGVEQVPTLDSAAQAASAEVASVPVGVTSARYNPIDGFSQAISAAFVPLGLWVGALAAFLILLPLPKRMLASTAGTGRLLVSALGRAGAIAVAQAALLVGLLHLALGVDLALLPATLGFSLLSALAFTTFHFLLVSAFGRAGLVVSLLVLAIQITSAGGLYPIEILAAPFQALSPFLPGTYAVGGMQSILAGGSIAPVLGAAAALAGFGVASGLLSLLVIRRARTASALGLIARPA